MYTQVNAQLQSQALALGAKPVYLDAEEAKKSEETMVGVIGRAWELWVRKSKDKDR